MSKGTPQLPQPDLKRAVALVTKMTVETKPAPIGANSSLTTVQCEITPPASSASDSPEVITVEGQLFGNLFGLMVSESASSGMANRVMTMAQFNEERYMKAFAAVEVKTPPRKFPVKPHPTPPLFLTYAC